MIRSAQKWMTAVMLFTALASPSFAQQKIYTVTHSIELDADTYQGFQLYRNWCARCHGTYGQGMAGPNLAISLNQLSRDEFMQIIAKGKMGRNGVMPGWEANKQIMDGREQIYSYLKARSDGAIGALKPEKAP